MRAASESIARSSCFRGTAGVATLGAAILLSACAEVGQTPAARALPVVQVLTLDHQEPAAERKFPARVQAHARASLAFQIEGTLLELPIKAGDIVERGQALARLDPRSFENAVTSGKADLTEASQQYQRFAKLVDAKVVPRDVYEKQKAAYTITQAAVRQLEKELHDTVLRAPFSGRVAKLSVQNFQNVQAGQPILELENVERLDLEIQVPAQYLTRLDRARLRIGEEIGAVEFDAASGKRFPVAIKEYATKADPRTGTFAFTLTLATPAGLGVLPGMTATFASSALKGDANSAFILPAAAVVANRGNKPYVWLVGDNGQTVSRREVRVDTLTGGHIRVLDGLSAGETIVSAGAAYLRDGMQVQVQALAPARPSIAANTSES